MNIFVLFILGWLLYRFIGGFLIPLFRASRQMRRQFHSMNRQANGQTDEPSGPGTEQDPRQEPTGSGSSKVGEYIDFEEVK